MNKVQIRFIKDAMDQPEKLSEWENNFIDDLSEKEDDYELSDKQNSVLNRIQGKLD
jgi:phenolic acid decarboxylase